MYDFPEFWFQNRDQYSTNARKQVMAEMRMIHARRQSNKISWIFAKNDIATFKQVAT